MPSPAYKTISILGDSIAAGYFDDGSVGWASRLGRKHQEDKPYAFYIRNVAVSGDHVTDCLERFRSQLSADPGDALIIACGVNDLARWGGRDSALSLSSAFSIEIWTKLLQEAKKALDLVYVCSLLPVEESRIPIRTNDQALDQYYRNDDIDSYNETLRDLCEKQEITFIDFSSYLANVDWQDCLFDDVHPNEKGHEMIALAVYQSIKGKLLEQPVR